MKYSLECKLLGINECEDIITVDDEAQGFVTAVFRHLEQKHRPFLSDFYAKAGLVELYRLISDRTERNK